MGCDIHAICEVKENGIWKLNPELVFKNPYYREGSNWNHEKEPMVSEPGIRRNYDLFGVLANVRNGRGFAGVKTGEGFHVIAMPKGLPEDISEEAKLIFGIRIDDEIGSGEESFYDENDILYITKSKAEEWTRKFGVHMLSEKLVKHPDYHSDSYLSIEELINFDWAGSYTELIGLISMEQYEKLRGTGAAPEAWTGGVWGGKTLKISTSQADQVLTGAAILPVIEGTEILVEYKWMVNYKEWFNYFLEEILKPMCELRTRYEDVRLVFSFDN